jgi:hypothetical protein
MLFSTEWLFRGEEKSMFKHQASFPPAVSTVLLLASRYSVICSISLVATPAFADTAAIPTTGNAFLDIILSSIPGLAVALVAYLKAHAAHSAAANATTVANTWDKAAIEIVTQIAQSVVDANKADTSATTTTAPANKP